MLIKHLIQLAIPIKGKLHVPDVLGMELSHRLKPGTSLRCTFLSPAGQQYELEGKVAFELINYKGRADGRIGGSLVFAEKPGDQIPIGWELFALVDDPDEKNRRPV